MFFDMELVQYNTPSDLRKVLYLARFLAEERNPAMVSAYDNLMNKT